MQATTVFEKLLTEELSSIHKTRFRAVLFAIKAIIRANTLSLPQVARAYPGPTTPKAHYKRLDRLINNPRLHGDMNVFWRWLFDHAAQGHCRPIVLVDWTEIGDQFHALTAAIPFGGRSLPILWRVYPEGMQNSPRAHQDLLDSLQAMLPDGVRPILVTDGMFRGPWFRAIQKLGWDYVGRISYLGTIIESPRRREKGYDIVKRAQDEVSDLGTVGVFREERRVMGRAVLGRTYKRDPKRSPRKRTYKDRGFSRKIARKRHVEPWILLTSLDKVSAEAVDHIYALRMRIEELYRDTKNPRFGWALRHLRLRSAKRYEALLLLATLAMAVVIGTGQAGEHLGFARHYQSNTITIRRVLSLFVLGQAIIRRDDIRRLTMTMWRTGWQILVDQTHACFRLAHPKSGET